MAKLYYWFFKEFLKELLSFFLYGFFGLYYYSLNGQFFSDKLNLYIFLAIKRQDLKDKADLNQELEFKNKVNTIILYMINIKAIN